MFLDEWKVHHEESLEVFVVKGLGDQNDEATFKVETKSNLSKINVKLTLLDIYNLARALWLTIFSIIANWKLYWSNSIFNAFQNK